LRAQLEATEDRLMLARDDMTHLLARDDMTHLNVARTQEVSLSFDFSLSLSPLSLALSLARDNMTHNMAHCCAHAGDAMHA
jgi:hypothetical protein